MDGWIIKPNGWEDIEYKLIKSEGYEYHEGVLSQYDEIKYIFVLAGGLNDQSENHDWVIRRLEVAIALYRRKQRKIICLGGGTYHKKPHLNQQGFVIHESSLCAQYLISQGVPHYDIMREWSSYDTIANGVFAFFNYIVPLNISKCAVITSDFHIERAMAIFNWINKLYNGVTAIEFISVDSDTTAYQDIISARVEREKQSLINLQNHVVSNITTIESLHTWFYTQHNAYNCILANKESLPSKVTATY